MSARGSGQASNTKEKPTTATVLKQNPSKKASTEKTSSGKSCRFRVPTRSELSPLRILKQIGDKLVSAIHFMSMSRTNRMRRGRSSTTAPSSGRSNPSIAPLDSHRAEAISDCIEFINNSSSFSRCNSVPTGTSHQPPTSS